MIDRKSDRWAIPLNSYQTYSSKTCPGDISVSPLYATANKRS
jgi:hypothetical protein